MTSIRDRNKGPIEELPICMSFSLVAPIGMMYLYEMGWKWMQANLVIFSILMPQNIACFNKLK